MENIIFIVLNVLFFTVLILFLVLRADDAPVFEERYAKQIALAIDASQPGMQIKLKIDEKALKIARENLGKNAEDKIVSFEDNVITFKLRGNGGYSYSFFNDVKVNDKFDIENKLYVMNIEENE